MSEVGRMIVDTAERIFADSFDRQALCRAANGEWLARQWAVLEEAGLPLALVGEDAGGFGIETTDALALVGLAARFAVPLPLVETMFANHLLALAGLELAEGPASIVMPRAADTLSLKCVEEGNWMLTGQAVCVPFARHVDSILLVVGKECRGVTEYRLVRVRKGCWAVHGEGRSISGTPLDRVSFRCIVTPADCAALPDRLGHDIVLRGGAALRAIGMAGAIQRVLDMTADYLQTRRQFGRELSKFQALQHEIAKMAGQSAAAAGAAGIAAEAFAGGFAEAPIAAAKARAGEAGGIVAGLAHQLHGAIGVTEEFDLHHLTRQIWAWRDEFGNEAYWNHRLGTLALESDEDLWGFVTSI